MWTAPNSTGSRTPGSQRIHRSQRRDRLDGTLGRAVRPEQAAPDAIVIDTTGHDAGAVVDEILERATAVWR